MRYEQSSLSEDATTDSQQAMVFWNEYLNVVELVGNFRRAVDAVR